MYALEKRERNRWTRYALCTRRWPLDQVVKGLKDASIWRVIYAADVHLIEPQLKRAA